MVAARVLLIVGLLFLAAGRPAPAAAQPSATTFVVNSVFDEPDATTLDGLCFSTPSGRCTLRAAVQQANASPDHDTILLDPGFYVLNRVGVDDTAFAGDLDIYNNLTMRGAGMYSTTIVVDYNAIQERVLHVVYATVQLEALGLTGGNTAETGGGIYNTGQLTLDHTRVFSNHATFNDPAGGIFSTGALTITDSLIEHNEVDNGGGGLYNVGVARIFASTFAYNEADEFAGGGIYNVNTLELVNTTLSNNTSEDGGSALHNTATGVVNAYNVTITANRANTDEGDEPAAAAVTNLSGGIVNLRNSIVARNYEFKLNIPYYDDCSGTLGIYGYNYFSPLGYSPPGAIVAPCTFSIAGGSQAFLTIQAGDLLPLANNGGPTPTHDLDPTAPAYDGADPVNGCVDVGGLIPLDQRGVPRVAGVRCDAGAVEHGSLWRLFVPVSHR